MGYFTKLPGLGCIEEYREVEDAFGNISAISKSVNTLDREATAVVQNISAGFGEMQEVERQVRDSCLGLSALILLFMIVLPFALCSCAPASSASKSSLTELLLEQGPQFTEEMAELTQAVREAARLKAERDQAIPMPAINVSDEEDGVARVIRVMCPGTKEEAITVQPLPNGARLCIVGAKADGGDFDEDFTFDYKKDGVFQLRGDEYSYRDGVIRLVLRRVPAQWIKLPSMSLALDQRSVQSAGGESIWDKVELSGPNPPGISEGFEAGDLEVDSGAPALE